MSIEKNSVVTFHYTVAETGKEPLESSKDGNALTVLVGHGAIIPGLEEALIGKQAGDKVEATVSPDQAYGERRDGMTQRIPELPVEADDVGGGRQRVAEREQRLLAERPQPLRLLGR